MFHSRSQNGPEDAGRKKAVFLKTSSFEVETTRFSRELEVVTADNVHDNVRGTAIDDVHLAGQQCSTTQTSQLQRDPAT